MWFLFFSCQKMSPKCDVFPPAVPSRTSHFTCDDDNDDDDDDDDVLVVVLCFSCQR
jgi:hypothetical protein